MRRVDDVLAAVTTAQTVVPAYAGSYSLQVIGSVPGLPSPYGGLTFLDGNTLLIGGAANTPSGRLYTIDVTRDAGGHITGFVGTAAVYGSVGENNDGGVTFGPGGVLFTTRYNQNELGQTKPGSTDENKVTPLTPLGIASSVGGAEFVPTGLSGAGQFKLGPTTRHGGTRFRSRRMAPAPTRSARQRCSSSSAVGPRASRTCPRVAAVPCAGGARLRVREQRDRGV